MSKPDLGRIIAQTMAKPVEGRTIETITDEILDAQRRGGEAILTIGRCLIEAKERYEVNSSTVSRGIRRGLDNAYRYLRFVSPLFVKAPQKRGYLSKGRKRKKRCSHEKQ